MEDIDLKKTLKPLYSPSAKTFETVEVPDMQFLMVDGHGNPNGLVYQQAVEALYAVAFPLKFALKKAIDKNYSVMPLEGLWWVPDMREFTATNKDAWLWTAMILQPPEVTQDLFESVRADAGKKDLPALTGMRLDTYAEGLAAQILYFGPYADEGPTIQRLHAHIHEQGGTLHGKHHEIYLGDPRRADPAKLKTIIRQPYKLS